MSKNIKLTLSQRTVLIQTIGIFSTLFIIDEICIKYLRPLYGKGEGFIAVLLGFLPNFLAGVGMPILLVGIYYYFLFEKSQHSSQKSAVTLFIGRKAVLFFTSIAFFCTAGLITWEFIQGGRHRFDYNDIIATIAGGLLSIGYLTFAVLPSQK